MGGESGVGPLVSSLSESNSLPGAAELETEEENDDEEDSSEVDGLFIRSRPTYLDALFDNDILHPTDHEPGPAQAPMRSRVKDGARAVLQSLIPTKGHVISIANLADGWLSAMLGLLPFTTVVRSGDDIVARYDGMRQKTVEPTILASWLIALAQTIEHKPVGRIELVSAPESSMRASEYSRVVADAVEKSVTACDPLAACYEGVETSLMLVRL